MNGCPHMESATRRTFDDVAQLCAEADLILHFYPHVAERQIERLKTIVADVREKANAGRVCRHCLEQAPPYAKGPTSRKLLIRLPLSLLAMFVFFMGVLRIIEWAI